MSMRVDAKQNVVWAGLDVVVGERGIERKSGIEFRFLGETKADFPNKE